MSLVSDLAQAKMPDNRQDECAHKKLRRGIRLPWLHAVVLLVTFLCDLASSLQLLASGNSLEVAEVYLMCSVVFGCIW